MLAGKIGRAATGSPQPPLGGGLLLYVAIPSARLRACPGLESVRQDRAGRSLPAAEARNSLTVVRDLRRLQPELIFHFEFFTFHFEFAGAAAARSSLTVVRDLRRLQPELESVMKLHF